MLGGCNKRDGGSVREARRPDQGSLLRTNTPLHRRCRPRTGPPASAHPRRALTRHFGESACQEARLVGLTIRGPHPCSRSASWRPARPSTTSTRRRLALTWAQSVGDGIEDYYLTPRRGPGPVDRRGWSRARSRAATSRPRRFEASWRVWTRATGLPLRAASSPARVAGFDLTFSAPKSVSVLFGLGDPELGDLVRKAHDVAALEAIRYLERSAAAVRRGHAGAIVEEASGLRRCGVPPPDLAGG